MEAYATTAEAFNAGNTILNRLVLGGSKAGTGSLTNFFTGRIGQFAIYNVALDTTTLNAVIAALGEEAGLVTYAIGYTANPQPQIDQNLQISAVVDGFTATLRCDPLRACSPISFIWNSVQFLVAPDHGQGMQWAHNAALLTTDATSWNRCSPTEQGSQDDGSSSSVCSSVNLSRSKSADGRTMKRRTKGAFWLEPGATLHGADSARNQCILADFGETEVTNTIGFGGDDHIITFHSEIIVTDEPLVTDCEVFVPCPLTIYGPDSTFTVFEWLTPSTGARSAYPGYPASANDKTLMMSSADETKACCPAIPFAELDEGFIQGYELPGFKSAFVLPRHTELGGITPRTAEYHPRFCFGTVANVVTAAPIASAA
jgi:hypothetical protein